MFTVSQILPKVLTALRSGDHGGAVAWLETLSEPLQKELLEYLTESEKEKIRKYYEL